MKNRISTRDEAAAICELFEDVLDQYDITVPSPEDDEREVDNCARLYGSVYYGLLDAVEARICDILDLHATPDIEVIRGRFAGSF